MSHVTEDLAELATYYRSLPKARNLFDANAPRMPLRQTNYEPPAGKFQSSRNQELAQD
jgi:hypothetical protein